MGQHTAAFINAIAEEGTKDEAVEWLQKTWNELCEARARNAALVSALKKFNHHFGPIEDNEMLHEDARECFRLSRAALALAGEK
jgi:hypothetical protein